MNTTEQSPLTPEESEFVDRFRDHYGPTPRTASQRVTLNEALEARIRRRRLPAWQPLAVAACAAALALWFVLYGWLGPGGDPTEVASGGSGGALVALILEEEEVAYGDDLLPADYATLASILEL